jgi:hypothetical protein
MTLVDFANGAPTKTPYFAFTKNEQSIDWKSLGYNPRKMQMHFEAVACHAEFI